MDIVLKITTTRLGARARGGPQAAQEALAQWIPDRKEKLKKKQGANKNKKGKQQRMRERNRNRNAKEMAGELESAVQMKTS